MRCLVTGAAGFIGSHVVAELRRAGHEVIGLDRRRSSDPSIWQVDLASPRDGGILAEVCAESDAVVHLAARPGVRDATPGIEHLRHRDNVTATSRLFAAVPLSVPVIVASSSSVYGGARQVAGQIRPSSEDDPLLPRGGYARSKVEVERLCAARRSAGAPVAVFRPFTVAGEGQRPDMAFSRWIAAARSGAPVTILGGPGRVRDVTDVADVAFAVRRILETGFVGTVNVGTGVGRRLVDLVEAVVAVLGRPLSVEIASAGGEEAEATLADTRKCESELGFRPVTDLHELLRRQVVHSVEEASERVLRG